TLSSQLGALHRAGSPEHTPLSQSASMVHSPSTGHNLPQPELTPQSTPPSIPFWIPSSHEAATQMRPRHRPFKQSSLRKHRCSSAHSGQVAPPQSSSVSSWFCTPSVQVGAAHSWPLHTFSSQSLSTRQPPPVEHGKQSRPPQSTSVSPGSISLLLQWGNMPPTSGPASASAPASASPSGSLASPPSPSLASF